MAPIKFGVGQSVLRKEDDALIRGRGRYTDDHAPSAAMHALVLRSPHAHAKFTINATRARGLPGVGTILTADDVRDLGDLPCLFNLPEDPFTGPPYPRSEEHTSELQSQFHLVCRLLLEKKKKKKKR